MSDSHCARIVQRRLLAVDGARIHAVLSQPREPQESHGGHREAPVGIVLAHGFAGSVTKEANRRVLRHLCERVPVIAFDFRGHGRSSHECTLGDKEVLDVAAAVRWGRTLGWSRVVTVGFSMGAAVVLRHAGVTDNSGPDRVDAVAAVSGPAFWNYRGTPVMRRLHFGVEHPVGRRFVRHVLRTRVVAPPWPQPWPLAPSEAAALIPPVPLLIVHGTVDPFFPAEHPQALVRAAEIGAVERGLSGYRAEYWQGDFGHAEVAIPSPLLGDLVDWVERVTQ